MSTPPGPVVIEIEPDAQAPNPADAPMIVDEVDFERPTAVAQATRMAAAPASWLARVFWFAITSLFLLWLSGQIIVTLGVS